MFFVFYYFMLHFFKLLFLCCAFLIFFLCRSLFILFRVLYVALISYCTHFVLNFFCIESFCVTLFSYSGFSMLHNLIVAHSYMLCSLEFALFLYCAVLSCTNMMLHSLQVTLFFILYFFSSCTFFQFHSFHIAFLCNFLVCGTPA